MGSALDHLLTQPGDFMDYYGVLPKPRFTGMMEDFIKKLPKGITPESVESDPKLKNQIDEIRKEVGFSWTLDTVLKKLFSEEKYWSFYASWHASQSEDKIILGSDEVQTINRMGSTITNNPYLMKLFVPRKGKTWFQVPMYIRIGGLDCKVLLDMLHQDEEGNLWPIDLKTIGRGV